MSDTGREPDDPADDHSEAHDPEQEDGESAQPNGQDRTAGRQGGRESVAHVEDRTDAVGIPTERHAVRIDWDADAGKVHLVGRDWKIVSCAHHLVSCA